MVLTLSAFVVISACTANTTMSTDTKTPACKFPTFTLHPQGNPLKRNTGEPFIVADPSVLFDEGRFKMWFTTGSNTVTGTGYAESSDGLIWTQRQTSLPDNVIIQPVRGTWQHDGRETVSVLKKDNLYQMWYTGYPNCWFLDSYKLGRRKITSFIILSCPGIWYHSLRAVFV